MADYETLGLFCFTWSIMIALKTNLTTPDIVFMLFFLILGSLAVFFQKHGREVKNGRRKCK